MRRHLQQHRGGHSALRRRHTRCVIGWHRGCLPLALRAGVQSRGRSTGSLVRLQCYLGRSARAETALQAFRRAPTWLRWWRRICTRSATRQTPRVRRTSCFAMPLLSSSRPQGRLLAHLASCCCFAARSSDGLRSSRTCFRTRRRCCACPASTSTAKPTRSSPRCARPAAMLTFKLTQRAAERGAGGALCRDRCKHGCCAAPHHHAPRGSQAAPAGTRRSCCGGRRTDIPAGAAATKLIHTSRRIVRSLGAARA